MGVDASTLFSISDYHAEKEIKKKNINANTSDIKDITTFLKSDVMSDIMMATFGNDALVIATREGFHTTEFNHD